MQLCSFFVRFNAYKSHLCGEPMSAAEIQSVPLKSSQNWSCAQNTEKVEQNQQIVKSERQRSTGNNFSQMIFKGTNSKETSFVYFLLLIFRWWNLTDCATFIIHGGLLSKKNYISFDWNWNFIAEYCEEWFFKPFVVFLL